MTEFGDSLSSLNPHLSLLIRVWVGTLVDIHIIFIVVFFLDMLVCHFVLSPFAVCFSFIHPSDSKNILLCVTAMVVSDTNKA